MTVLESYAVFVGYVRLGVFWVAVAVAILCLIDWTIRTRRISPFSSTARFFRRHIDPVIAPVEQRVLLAGGRPATAPWWALLAVVLAGILLIFVLQFVGSLIADVAYGVSGPGALLRVLLGWAFGILKLALIVRVLSSWFPISPYSRWIRWSYTLTEWMLRPLRAIIPMLGPLDITPLVAFILLGFIQGALHV